MCACVYACRSASVEVKGQVIGVDCLLSPYGPWVLMVSTFTHWAIHQPWPAHSPKRNTGLPISLKEIKALPILQWATSLDLSKGHPSTRPRVLCSPTLCRLYLGTVGLCDMDDLAVSIPAKRDKTTAQRLSGACPSHTGPGANITSYFCCFSSPKTLIPGTQHKQAHPINDNSLLCSLPPTTTRPEFKNYQGLKSC